MRLFERTPRYFLTVYGRPAQRSDVNATLEALPPGVGRSAKYVYGVWFADELIGCVDLIKGHPNPRTAYLGLLLLRDDRQGQGLGKELLGIVMRQAQSWGCERLRWAVIETNAQALAFWRKQGAVELYRRALPGHTGQARVLELGID